MINYHLYRNTWPLLALARYRRALDARTAGADANGNGNSSGCDSNGNGDRSGNDGKPASSLHRNGAAPS